MLIDFLDALSELLFNDAFLLIDFLLRLSLDQRIVLLGAEDRTRHNLLLLHILRIVGVSRRGWPNVFTAHFLHLSFSELLAVLFIERMVEYHLACNSIRIVDLIVLI